MHFFPHFGAAGLLVKSGCLWKLTGNLAQVANADPKWAGQKVCTHTSILSPAACGDVKHSDAVGACRSAPRSLLGSHDTRKDTDSYTRRDMINRLHQKVVALWQIKWLAPTDTLVGITTKQTTINPIHVHIALHVQRSRVFSQTQVILTLFILLYCQTSTTR